MSYPPTRTFRMLKRPCSSVTASYLVPVAVWTAVTVDAGQHAALRIPDGAGDVAGRDGLRDSQAALRSAKATTRPVRL